MAESKTINGEIATWVPSILVNNIYYSWVHSENPEQIITCEKPKGISIAPDKPFNWRFLSKEVKNAWRINITTQGEELRQVALTLNPHRSNFRIKSVKTQSGKKIGITNGQEWYAPMLPDCDSPNSIKNPMTTDQKNERNYVVKISFISSNYGTYRQNIIFDFGKFPVILERVCVDCIPEDEFARLSDATQYQLSQNPQRWTEKTEVVFKFQSALVPPKDAKEENLAKIYPYPDKDNFFLTYSTLTETELTPENYRGRLHELVSIEELARHEQIARYNAITRMRILSNYILISDGDGSTVAKYTPPGELFAQLPLSRNISEDTKSGRLFLRSCHSILFRKIFLHGSSHVFEAHIEDKCIQTVYVRLSRDCVSALNLVPDTDVDVQVQFVLSRISFCEWHRAIDCLSDEKLVFINSDHRENAVPSVLDLLDMDATCFLLRWNWLILDSVLNPVQKKAVAIITSSTDILLPPILLLGPFGTGKTFTIAQAIRLLLNQNLRHKILLCTHSNSAADLYIKEFFDVWYKTDQSRRLKPVRIYYRGRARNTVHPVVQEYCLTDQYGCFRDAMNEDLLDCGLIVTTLGTASSLTTLNLSLTHIVIDEAAQALECEALMALALATPKTRVILAGDHMQLAPEIYSDLASERGLGISILERFYKSYPKEHPCRIHLCLNYRAHEDIIAFTSEMFYEGMVAPGSKQLLPHPTMKPLTFYTVLGEEIQGMHSTGYAHATEACELADRVAELKSAWPVDRWGPYGEGSIGVLAYYGEQVQRIRIELRKRKMHDVSVERVLNVQGKQFTAVFISVVRTRYCCHYTSADSSIKDYGFLSNPRLLSTAITRAKCLVAVVGDPIGLLTIGSCKKLWKRFLDVADLKGMDKKTMKQHLQMLPKPPPVIPLNPLAQEFVPRNPQPCFIQYIPVPMMYPVMHCAPNCWSMH